MIKVAGAGMEQDKGEPCCFLRKSQTPVRVGAMGALTKGHMQLIPQL